MSWRDRPYAGDEGQPELRIQFRRPSTTVTMLIAVNAAIFVIDVISQHWGTGGGFHRLFGLSLAGLRNLYFWQPLTYMFVHGGVWHLLMNMIGLYVFGMEFERAFGRQRFLEFYGICGLVGGAAYLVLSAVSPQSYYGIPLIGASGAIYGLLVAAIIFFPHIQVILFIFPIPIRVFGLLVAAILLLQFIGPGQMENAGGELCHVAGAAAGVATFYAWGIMPRIRIGRRGGQLDRLQEGAWARRQKQAAAQQAEVDRILEKIHTDGLNSLTRKEKKILAEATRHQREREEEIGRTDRL